MTEQNVSRSESYLHSRWNNVQSQTRFQLIPVSPDQLTLDVFNQLRSIPPLWRDNDKRRDCPALQEFAKWYWTLSDFLLAGCMTYEILRRETSLAYNAALAAVDLCNRHETDVQIRNLLRMAFEKMLIYSSDFATPALGPKLESVVSLLNRRKGALKVCIPRPSADPRWRVLSELASECLRNACPNHEIDSVTMRDFKHGSWDMALLFAAKPWRKARQTVQTGSEVFAAKILLSGHAREIIQLSYLGLNERSLNLEYPLRTLGTPQRPNTPAWAKSEAHSSVSIDAKGTSTMEVLDQGGVQSEEDPHLQEGHTYDDDYFDRIKQILEQTEEHLANDCLDEPAELSGDQRSVDAVLVGLSDEHVVFLTPRRKCRVWNSDSTIQLGYSTDLEEGDILVLDDQHLRDIRLQLAEAELRAQGAADLILKKTQWKTLLRQAIAYSGTPELFRQMRQAGHQVSSHGYIALWATERILLPESYPRFSALMNAVARTLSKTISPERILGWWEATDKYRQAAEHATLRAEEILEIQLKTIGCPITEFPTPVYANIGDAQPGWHLWKIESIFPGLRPVKQHITGRAISLKVSP